MSLLQAEIVAVAQEYLNKNLTLFSHIQKLPSRIVIIRLKGVLLSLVNIVELLSIFNLALELGYYWLPFSIDNLF